MVNTPTKLEKDRLLRIIKGRIFTCLCTTDLPIIESSQRFYFWVGFTKKGLSNFELPQWFSKNSKISIWDETYGNSLYDWVDKTLNKSLVKDIFIIGTDLNFLGFYLLDGKDKNILLNLIKLVELAIKEWCRTAKQVLGYTPKFLIKETFPKTW